MTWLKSAFCVAVIVMLASQVQADFKLYSQNTLHLGYRNSKAGDDYKPRKYKFLSEKIIQNADVVLFQEVMRQANPAEFKLAVNYAFFPNIAVPPPPIFWPNLKGFGGYKEAYLLAANLGAAAGVGTPASGIEVLCYISLKNPIYFGAQKLARPPDIYLVRGNSSKTGKMTWLVNFHAIWGANPSQREAEATTLATFSDILKTKRPNLLAASPYAVSATGCGTSVAVNRIVLAGDWNLPTNKLLTIFSPNYQALPSQQTSVSPSGELSSSYDHFIWTSTVAVSVPPPAVFDPTGHMNNFPKCTLKKPPSLGVAYCQFRENISDHLGVYLTIED